MHTIEVSRIVEHNKDMLVDYCELLLFTQSFEQGIKQGFQIEDAMEFIQEREQRIHDVKQKEVNSVSLRAVICQEFELSEFTLNKLRTKISGELWNALSAVMTDTQKVIEEIQGIDTRLNQTLEMELEATKLELHRFQNVQRLHHAYQPENERDARFIDKIK